MTFDDILGHGKAQTGAVMAFLGSKKRLENLSLNLFRDAGTGIADGDGDPAVVGPGGNGDDTLAPDGFGGVHQQRYQDLLHLAGVGDDFADGRV